MRSTLNLSAAEYTLLLSIDGALASPDCIASLSTLVHSSGSSDPAHVREADHRILHLALGRLRFPHTNMSDIWSDTHCQLHAFGAQTAGYERHQTEIARYTRATNEHAENCEKRQS